MSRPILPIGCSRVGGCERIPPGCTIGLCSRCGSCIWLSPEFWSVPERFEFVAELVCNPCYTPEDQGRVDAFTRRLELADDGGQRP